MSIDSTGPSGSTDPINYTELIEIIHERVRNDRSESTADRYKSNTRAWLVWCDDNGIDPLDARPNELRSHLRDMADDGYAPNSLKVRRAAISMFFKQAHDIAHDRTACISLDPDTIADNPSDELDLTHWKPMNQTTRKEKELREQEGIHYLEPEDKEKLCDNVVSPSFQNELLIRLLYQTGLRVDELAQVRLEDVDQETRKIKIWADKPHLNRAVYYQPSLDFLIEQWIDGPYRASVPGSGESSYLFPTREKERMTGNYINTKVRESAENAGIQSIMYTDAGGAERAKVTAHALRHSYAVQSLLNGMKIVPLQRILGHENLGTTARYLRITDSTVEDEARRFGAGLGNDPDTGTGEL